MNEAERAQLEELEKRQQMVMLQIHQTRLLNSALRREIRLAKKALVDHGRFERLDKIRWLSDTVYFWVRELQIDSR
jgi:hypothetical protein